VALPRAEVLARVDPLLETLVHALDVGLELVIVAHSWTFVTATQLLSALGLALVFGSAQVALEYHGS